MRDKNGKFKKGASGNPAGRPAKATTVFAKALQTESDAIIKKTISLAKSGDVACLKICMDRLMPALKPTAAPVQFETDGDNLADFARCLITATANGNLPPDVCAQLVSSISTLARVNEILELEQRIAAMEEALNAES